MRVRGRGLSGLTSIFREGWDAYDGTNKWGLLLCNEMGLEKNSVDSFGWRLCLPT